MSQNAVPMMGNYVTDLLTGVTGHVSAILYKFGGSIQLCIQPVIDLTKPDVMPDAWYVDLHQIKVLEVPEGVHSFIDNVIPIDESLESSNFPLGSTVVDILTDIEWKILNRSVHLNGCVIYMCIRSIQQHGDTVAVDAILNQHRLELKQVAPVKFESKQPDQDLVQQTKAPGGPAMKAVRV